MSRSLIMGLAYMAIKVQMILMCGRTFLFINFDNQPPFDATNLAKDGCDGNNIGISIIYSVFILHRKMREQVANSFAKAEG